MDVTNGAGDEDDMTGADVGIINDNGVSGFWKLKEKTNFI